MLARLVLHRVGSGIVIVRCRRRGVTSRGQCRELWLRLRLRVAVVVIVGGAVIIIVRSSGRIPTAAAGIGVDAAIRSKRGGVRIRGEQKRE